MCIITAYEHLIGTSQNSYSNLSACRCVFFHVDNPSNTFYIIICTSENIAEKRDNI